IAAEREDPGSMLSFFRALVELRRATPALAVGAYNTVDAGQADVLAYLRSHEGDRLLIALNFSERPFTLDLSDYGDAAELLLSTKCDSKRHPSLQRLELAGNEGVILRLR